LLGKKLSLANILLTIDIKFLTVIHFWVDKYILFYL
jgi:hypothetical protein